MLQLDDNDQRVTHGKRAGGSRNSWEAVKIWRYLETRHLLRLPAKAWLDTLALAVLHALPCPYFFFLPSGPEPRSAAFAVSCLASVNPISVISLATFSLSMRANIQKWVQLVMTVTSLHGNEVVPLEPRQEVYIDYTGGGLALCPGPMLLACRIPIHLLNGPLGLHTEAISHNA
eukprot:1159335-Pelagomonas_calceolata.AAC.2